MFTRTLSVTLILFMVVSSAAFAAGDPMQSLFLFQKKMADKGSAPAMMQMGQMYERGEGVKKDLNKAIEMYQKADKAGHANAKAAIQKLTGIKNKSNKLDAQKAKKKEEERQRALAKEKQRKQQEAAARKKEQDAKNAAKEKAIRDAKNKEKAAKLANEAKAKKLREAKAKANKEAKAKAAKAKAEKAKAAKTAKAKAAKIKAEREAKARAIRIAAEKKRQEAKNPKEGFNSDACKGKAAKFTSKCRK